MLCLVCHLKVIAMTNDYRLLNVFCPLAGHTWFHSEPFSSDDVDDVLLDNDVL